MLTYDGDDLVPFIDDQIDGGHSTDRLSVAAAVFAMNEGPDVDVTVFGGAAIVQILQPKLVNTFEEYYVLRQLQSVGLTSTW